MSALHIPHTGLAIESALLDLKFALGEQRGAVLVAPPGTGKSTVAPLHIAADTTGRVLLLEPRRIAARAVALRLAELLGEPLGRTVGLRTRDETTTSPGARIEVVTEGVLLAMLHNDASLAGVDVVIFDEFHERSLDADLGLALALDCRLHLRPDLAIVVMSATLDPAVVADLLDGAPVINAGASPFPVTVLWQPRPLPTAAERLAKVPHTVREALRAHAGDVLVFLPGAAEIRRVTRALSELAAEGVEVVALHGSLLPREQDAALHPGERRRVVVASALAETSLTIPRIGIVVDAGLARHAVFNPARGMSHLITEFATRAETEQRAGRAGRLGPGVAYRLWTEAEHRRLPPAPPPDITRDDLCPLALHIARWGTSVSRLRWLNPPPTQSLQRARDLLVDLEALDASGQLTPRGRTMSDMALHPRLAHLVLVGHARGHGGLACDIAALAEDRDILVGAKTADITIRINALGGQVGPDAEVHRQGIDRVLRRARSLRRQIGVAGEPGDDHNDTGDIAIAGFPDRVAVRRREHHTRVTQIQRYRLPDGSGVSLDRNDPMLSFDALVVLDVMPSRGAEPRVALATGLSANDVAGLASPAAEVYWDPHNGDITAVEGRKLGAHWVDSRPWVNPPSDALIAAALAGVRREGMELFEHPARRWRLRVGYLRRVLGPQWPDLADAELLDTLEGWLAPVLAHQPPRRRKELAAFDVQKALLALVPWSLVGQLDVLAPDRLEMPSGSRVAINYDADQPSVAVKLQELFGLADLPRIADGAGTLQVHLLNPAGRVAHVTSDLASFWRTGYFDVRKELKGRYPKHPWPDDPLSATPTRHTKPRPR